LLENGNPAINASKGAGHKGSDPAREDIRASKSISGTARRRKMSKKRNDPQIKPVEEWTVKEWEAAYNVLMKRFEKLREYMRLAMVQLSKAI